MSGNEGQSGQRIGDSTFEMWLKGVNAVILFPALATPCLVKTSKGAHAAAGMNVEGMNVVIAVHQEHFPWLQQLAGGNLTVGAQVTEFIAGKFHSHLSLVEWGDTIVNQIFNDQYYKSHIDRLKSAKHQIDYDSRDPQAPYSYKGWYLGELAADKEALISLIGQNGKPAPFGTLHRAAAGLYARKGYVHLFQLRFSKVSQAVTSLCELVWLYFNHDAMLKLDSPEKYEQHLYGKPNDDVLTAVFESGDRDSAIVKDESGLLFIEPVNGDQKQPLLQPSVDTGPCPCIKEGKPDHWHQYRLWKPAGQFSDAPANKGNARNEGKKNKPLPYGLAGVDYASSAVPSSGRETVAAEAVPYMSQQGGTILASRHPVYFSEKPMLPIGVVSDVHLSSRQTLFRFAAAQVIPGADPKDSPYIGRMAHDNLQSTGDLLNKVAERSDMIVITGDLYDHLLNCDPSQCLKEMKTTGDLWYYLNYDKMAPKQPRLYPRHIDGMMMLSLITESYDRNRKPIFFVSGNHEAYEHPYGASPRLIGKTTLKLNAGIPADMNLTIYEAALIYGENYHRFHTIKNFNSRNMNWLYALFTPWKDCLVPYGDRQNSVLLGWGESEHIPKTLFAPNLPRASSACSENQEKLLKAAPSGAANILFAHFSLVSYDDDVPLQELRSKVSEYPNPGDNTKYTVGTAQRASLIAQLMRERKIQYSIAGHSHRAGVYWLYDSKSPHLVPRGLGPQEHVNADTRLDLDAAEQPLVMVCGSSGPYGRWNLNGQRFGLDLEKPQGLVFDPEFDPEKKQKQVSFVKSDAAAKPRLAVLLDYLWCVKKISPFLTPPGYPGDPHIWCAGSAPAQANVYTWNINPDFTAALGGNPIAKIRLYAVHKSQELPPMGPLSISPVNTNDGPGEAKLNITEQDVIDFFDGIENDNENIKINEFILFFSIALRDTSENLSEIYDIQSPWCFPVADDEFFEPQQNDIDPPKRRKRGFWRRLFRDLIGSEVPEFEDYKRDEYKRSK